MHRKNYIQASLCDCRCGAQARYQYRIPLHWVECPMCNAHTQKYRDAMGEVFDMNAREKAVNEWNNMAMNNPSVPFHIEAEPVTLLSEN